MKVRVKQSERYVDWYDIETRPVWWPFWSYHTMAKTMEKAIERAKSIKKPKIVEITDET